MPVLAKEKPCGGDSTAWLCRLAAATIGAAALAAYSGAFSGPFLYDDQGSVTDNPTIRHLGSAFHPPASGWPVSGRPVFNFSLALNYAVSGDRTWSYHALSLLIHIGAGLALFGIVRRTLAAIGFSPLRALAAGWASALLWTVHPVQTESVTYISQRAESLMGLFYLLTLYGFIRYAEAFAGRAGPLAPPGTAGEPGGAGGPALPAQAWAGLSVVCCLLGMATKEVMVTAPVMVLLYDRVFAARTWKGVLQRRGYYLALAATWLALAILMVKGGGRGGTVGFGTTIAWWAYGVTQFHAVAHYLRLCFWPHPLLFSYGLTLGGPPWEVAWDAVMVIGLASLSLIAAIRGSRIGFLGAWFFIILSPTSTVVPVATELIAEHRVYLSVAAVTTLIVCGAEELGRRLTARFGRTGSWFDAAAVVAVGLAALAAGTATHHRNRVYASVQALWADTVAKSPDDAGARNNLGNALAEEGRPEEAVVQFREALRLVPGYDDPHFNLGNTLVKLGRTSEAIPHYQSAVRVQPDNARIRYALGAALRKIGCTAEAHQQFERALTGASESPVVWYDLGNAFLDEGQLEDAKRALAMAIRLRPDYADALVNHAGVLAQLNEVPAAIEEFQAALRIQPGAADVHNNLGGLLAESGRLAEARQQFEAALALKPDYREARDNLQRVKAMELAAPR